MTSVPKVTPIFICDGVYCEPHFKLAWSKSHYTSTQSIIPLSIYLVAQRHCPNWSLDSETLTQSRKLKHSTPAIFWLNHMHPKNHVHEQHIRHGIVCWHETIWICHYKDHMPLPFSSRPLRGWYNLGIRIYWSGRFGYLKSTSKWPTTNGQRRPVILVLNTQLVVISLKWGSNWASRNIIGARAML